MRVNFYGHNDWLLDTKAALIFYCFVTFCPGHIAMEIATIYLELYT